MLDKLKQVNELRKIKNALKEEFSESEKDGVKVRVNGQMEIEEIIISPDLTKKKQEEALIFCINEAMQKIQMKIAQRIAKLQKN